MKNYLIGCLVLLMSCQSSPNSTETATKDSTGIEQKNEATPYNMEAEGTVLFETNKLLNQIPPDKECSFAYATGEAPNKDIMGEANLFQAEITQVEAKGLINLFNGKCHDEMLEKLSGDAGFWTEGQYNIKGYFNLTAPNRSYFTCLIYGNNKYAYYVLGNPNL